MSICDNGLRTPLMIECEQGVFRDLSKCIGDDRLHGKSRSSERLGLLYHEDDRRLPPVLNATLGREAKAASFLSGVQSNVSGVRRTEASNAMSMAPQPESWNC